MKCPSRRNSFPDGTLSWTSIAWKAERNCSKRRADRREKPHSAVSCSVMTSGARSCGAPVAPGTCPSAIHAPAMDHLILGPRGLQHGLECTEQPLRLVAIVGREIADIDIDGDEAALRPRVNGEMRFGEQHGAGD